jgi:sugar phosphate isomerase/epimerase
MVTIKGPGIFLAQFLGEHAPFNNLQSICLWAESLGFKGVQLPTWDLRVMDLEKAAKSKTYAEEIRGLVNESGLEITELAAHLQGQLVAVHPAYDKLFDGFAPSSVHGNSKARTEWAIQQLKWCAQASQNLGLNAVASFSGALAWPYVYPWPQRPAGLIEEAFTELANRWLPVLNFYDELGIDLCYEIHPSEDLHDGITYERFLGKVNAHKRACLLYDPSHFVLQSLDYLSYIDHYRERIKMFHVKDAEFNPTGKQGVYGGYQEWIDRAGRFRSLGDGQIDFNSVFSKLSQYDFPGWAVLEWECCLKNSEDGAREGAEFIQRHIINTTDRSFDNFAGAKADKSIRPILGLD